VAAIRRRESHLLVGIVALFEDQKEKRGGIPAHALEFRFIKPAWVVKGESASLKRKRYTVTLAEMRSRTSKPSQ
jgi:hypothetical protein